MIDSREIARNNLSSSGYQMLIGGAWTTSGKTFAVNNPATGEHLTEVPDASPQDVRAAIDSASKALPAWSSMPAPSRGAILRKIAALLMERQERLATVMTLEQGKPLAESRGEIAFTASFFAWYAGEAERIYGQSIPASVPNKRLMVILQPVGVCAMITPWNFPAAMLARKVAPALAAGCTVVAKPAEQTPLSAIEIAAVCADAGLPSGVFNLITTNDPGMFSDEIYADTRVRKVSFTGSTEVGKMLLRRSADHVKRVSLELGGNAPFIVFDDASLDAALTGAIASKYRNNGQTCVCANRIFVQRGIYEKFADAFTARVKGLHVGNGLDAATIIGPLINAEAFDKVQRHVADATKNGARVLTGGAAFEQAGLKGAFWTPTVLANARADMMVAREETFGPVAPLIPFESEEEVIRLANDTQYGLAAYFYSRDYARVIRVSEALEYGIIGANDALPAVAQAPFGGYKESGLGRESGSVGMDAYLEVKYISIGL